jgi:hypothetical protein
LTHLITHGGALLFRPGRRSGIRFSSLSVHVSLVVAALYHNRDAQPSRQERRLIFWWNSAAGFLQVVDQFLYFVHGLPQEKKTVAKTFLRKLKFSVRCRALAREKFSE